MGRATGSRECTPDDKLRDTHQINCHSWVDWFRKGLNPSCELLVIAPFRSLRVPANFINQFNLICSVQSPSSKIFPFSKRPNHLYIPAVPSPRGAYPDRQRRGAECGGRGSVRQMRDRRAGSSEPVSGQTICGRTALVRTAKSCGPDVSTPASSQRRRSRPNRARASHIPYPLATVTNKPDHRGEHEISR
jgi:hypothetical protein